jgi:HPt (histidine-containing phosphotransfer) domain-containing protein
VNGVYDIWRPRSDEHTFHDAATFLAAAVRDPAKVGQFAKENRNPKPGSNPSRHDLGAIAAGMTDYLSKPIRVAELEAAIERNFAPGSGRVHEMVDDELDKSAFSELYDTVGAEVFARLVESFLNEATRSLDEVRTEVAGNDADRVRTAAHRLSGLFGQFGAQRAADAARAVELADDEDVGARSGDLLIRGEAAIAAMRMAHPAAIGATRPAAG